MSELLAIYLNDHRAGAAGGLSLVRRMAGRYGEDPEYAVLLGLRDDIAADVDDLDRLRARLGVPGARLKCALAVLAERLGRLKLNGRLVRRSPLSPLLELELLTGGVAAKRQLWIAMMAACGSEEVAGVDLHRLRDRADDQLERLRRLHLRAASGIECHASSDGRGSREAPRRSA